MAKKGLQVQLQTELNDDQEFAEFLEREGLLLIDVYSDWCGPCAGMQATIKKIKVEVGGDLLQLAIAKCDNIAALARFRYKSEPTWLFISKGKVVNLLFGADAPKLSRIILSELKKETQSKDENTDRNGWELDEMTEEEKKREEEADSVLKTILKKEAEKKAEETRKRREQEVENILSNLSHYGVVVIFPHLRDKYKEVLSRELLEEAGVSINQLEKVVFTDDWFQEILNFSEIGLSEFTNDALEQLKGPEKCALVLLKVSRGVEVEDIDLNISKMVYGESRIPPGSPESLARKLEKEYEEPGEEDEPAIPKTGIWAPTNERCRAVALKLFFPKLTANFVIPDPAPEPPYLAVIFGMNRIDDVTAAMEKYPDEIMRYGIFDSAEPEQAQFLAKTFKGYERLPEKHIESDQIVIQLSKKHSTCIFDFAQLGPNYISPNPTEGKIDCYQLFPEGYDEIEEKEEEVPQEEPHEVEEPEITQTLVEPLGEVPLVNVEEKLEQIDENKAQEESAASAEPTVPIENEIPAAACELVQPEPTHSDAPIPPPIEQMPSNVDVPPTTENPPVAPQTTEEQNPPENNPVDIPSPVL